MSKVDFSILNNDDIFYIVTGTASDWLSKGDFLAIDKSKHMSLSNLGVYRSNALCSRESVKKLRKATPEEYETFYKAFPEERELIKEIIETTTYLTIKDMHEAGWKFDYTK